MTSREEREEALHASVVVSQADFTPSPVAADWPDLLGIVERNVPNRSAFQAELITRAARIGGGS